MAVLAQTLINKDPINTTKWKTDIGRAAWGVGWGSFIVLLASTIVYPLVMSKENNLAFVFAFLAPLFAIQLVTIYYIDRLQEKVKGEIVGRSLAADGRALSGLQEGMQHYCCGGIKIGFNVCNWRNHVVIFSMIFEYFQLVALGACGTSSGQSSSPEWLMSMRGFLLELGEFGYQISSIGANFGPTPVYVRVHVSIRCFGSNMPNRSLYI